MLSGFRAPAHTRYLGPFSVSPVKKHVFLPLFLCSLASLAGAQDTIHVPGDVSNIQAGVGIANAGDTILVAPGTYNETVDFLGKAVTVVSEGGPAVTHIDPLGLGSAVLFHNQERNSSVLRGFTITGGLSSTNPGGGISCLNLAGSGGPASPLIQDCIIENNATTFASGGGVGGNATLIACIIRNNDAGLGCGGGVWGAATLIDCLVTNNEAQDGGGLFLQADGALVQNCMITGNRAIDGARGGGIHAAPGRIEDDFIRIEGCTLLGNVSNGLGQASSRGGALHVSANPGIVEVVGCTLLDNQAIASIGGDDYGGIFGPASVKDTICRDNEANQISANTTCTYSNIQGGAPGLGNLDGAALFVDRANGNFMLVPGSTGVDGGDPASPLDPDCTRADQGAHPLFQASVTIRNGTGVNPVCFASLTYPVIGSTWTGRVDTSAAPNANFALVLGDNGFMDLPFMTTFGAEAIIELDSVIIAVPIPASGGLDEFSVNIPNETNLIGFDGAMQAFFLSNTTPVGACNALQIKLGL